MKNHEWHTIETATVRLTIKRLPEPLTVVWDEKLSRAHIEHFGVSCGEFSCSKILAKFEVGGEFSRFRHVTDTRHTSTTCHRRAGKGKADKKPRGAWRE